MRTLRELPVLPIHQRQERGLSRSSQPGRGRSLPVRAARAPWAAAGTLLEDVG